MVFKTQIKIKDTGKRRVSSSSAEETEIVDSGNWITLNVSRIQYNITGEVNDGAVISKFENDDVTEIYGSGEIDKFGINVPTWTLSIKIDTTSSTDLEMFAKLVKLTKTKGVKLISGVTTSASIINYVNYYDNYFQDISKTASAVNSGIYVRIKGLRIEEDANKKYSTVTLNLTETS